MLAPALLNWFVWDAGCHLFGFQFGGLGAVMYVFAVLPLNGFVLGLSAPQFLHSRLAGLRSEAREFAVGILIEVGVLFANLAVLSKVHEVVGNVSS